MGDANLDAVTTTMPLQGFTEGEVPGAQAPEADTPDLQRDDQTGAKDIAKGPPSVGGLGRPVKGCRAENRMELPQTFIFEVGAGDQSIDWPSSCPAPSSRTCSVRYCRRSAAPRRVKTGSSRHRDQAGVGNGPGSATWHGPLWRPPRPSSGGAGRAHARTGQVVCGQAHGRRVRRGRRLSSRSWPASPPRGPNPA